MFCLIKRCLAPFSATMIMNMKQTGLTESIVRDIIGVVTRRASVHKIILYGSRARGDFKLTSDIDLAVDAPAWKALDLAVVKDELEEQVPTLLKFDLLLLSEIDKRSLKENIFKEGIVLHESARIRERLDDFNKALGRLQEVLAEDPRVSSAIIDGTIQRFEFTFELAWKTAQSILDYKGIRAANPRAIIKEAFQQGYLVDEKGWIAMLDDRNRSAHTYNEADAQKIYQAVKDGHYRLLFDFKERLNVEVDRM